MQFVKPRSFQRASSWKSFSAGPVLIAEAVHVLSVSSITSWLVAADRCHSSAADGGDVVVVVVIVAARRPDVILIL